MNGATAQNMVSAKGHASPTFNHNGRSGEASAPSDRATIEASNG